MWWRQTLAEDALAAWEEFALEPVIALSACDPLTAPPPGDDCRANILDLKPLIVWLTPSARKNCSRSSTFVLPLAIYQTHIVIITVCTIEMKLKKPETPFCFRQNKKPGVKRFSCFSQCRYTLFERQSRGGGGAITHAWRHHSQRWIVARYCNALLFGVPTGATRYVLPKVTPSVTSYFLPKLVTHMISMFVE